MSEHCQAPRQGAHSCAPPSELTPEQADFYQTLRQRMRRWLENAAPKAKYADMLMLAPDLFHVLCRLVADRRISPQHKAMLAAAIAYFVAPIGLVPEALVGPIGYIDDIALAAFVLNKLLNSSEAEVVREHWAGEQDVLSAVQGVLEVADTAIASGLWRKIQGIHLKGIKLPKIHFPRG